MAFDRCSIKDYLLTYLLTWLERTFINIRRSVERSLRTTTETIKFVGLFRQQP